MLPKYLAILSLCLISHAFATPISLPIEECLGRLTFSVPSSLQWASVITQTGYPIPQQAPWSPLNRWHYNQILLITSSAPTTISHYNDQWKTFLPSGVAKIEVQRTIDSYQRMVNARIETRKQQQAALASGEEISKYKLITEKHIQETKNWLAEEQERLRQMNEYQVPKFDLTIADGYTVARGDQRAFVWREPRVYMFYFSNRLGAVPLETVNQTLNGFAPRKLGELPKAPAFCFPYGSIADNGKIGSEIKNSFRLDTAPNVTYSLYTGNERFKPNTNIADQGYYQKPNPPSLSAEDKPRFTLAYPSYTLTLGTGEALTLNGWQLVETQPKDPKNPRHYYFLTGATQSSNTLSTVQHPYIGMQVSALPENEESSGSPISYPPLKQAIEQLTPILETIKVDLATSTTP